MTDQQTPPRLSAEQASAAMADANGTAAPAKPSRSRAPKPPAAPPAKPTPRAARSPAKATAPDEPEAGAALPASPSGADASSEVLVAPPAASATRPQGAARPAASPHVAAAHEAVPSAPGTAEPSDATPHATSAEAGTSVSRAAPSAMPGPSPAAATVAGEDLPSGDGTPASPDEPGPDAATAAAPGDDPDAEPGEDPESGEPDAPAARDEEDDEDEEEEAPRSSARMPGMGGGMARPGMRPISPQLGGRPTPAPRIPSKAENFVEGDHVVYPTHGVGRVERIATEEIAGHKLELIHITFEENRMTLRVPVAKARSAGLRKLATRKMFDEALAVLRGRARIKRTMWSRRAQEYEAKINSGDPLSIAEVVRDLHRNAGQPDQSFSERQIYEAAMDRLAAELAALDQTEKATAATKLVDYLKVV